MVLHTDKFNEKKMVRRVRACQQCGMAWRTFEDASVCRDCGNPDSNVTNSEKYEESIRRTRNCPTCRLVWKTFETVIDDHCVIDFKPFEISEAAYKRRRKPEYYADRIKAQLGLPL